MKPFKKIDQKYYTFLSVLVLFSASIIFWYPLIFLHKTLFFDLVTRYFYPQMTFFRTAIKSFQNPLWNPFIYSGMPFLANPQAGVFYPFNYLFVLLDFATALNCYLVLHTFLAGLFMYFLARHFKLTHLSALLAALIFMFNGFFVLHAEFISNIASYIWLPLIILYFDKYFREKDLQYLLFTAIILTLQFLGGMPAFSYYTVLFLALYFIFINPSLNTSFKLNLSNSALFISLIVMFFLFSFVQLLPSAELILNSARNQGLDYGTAIGYSIRIKDFIYFLFVPLWNNLRVFYEGDVHVVGFYFGLVSLILTLLFITRRQSKLKIFFLIIFAAASLLSLGKNLPFVYYLFYDYFPGFKYFRFPAQFVYISALSFAVIAAFSLENIKSIYLKAAIVFLAFAELFFFGAKANAMIDASYFTKETPGQSFLRCDTELYRFMLDPDLRKDTPSASKDSFSFWLNYKDMLYPNIGMACNFFDVDGYETLRLKEYNEVLDKVNGPGSKILDFLSMKYLLTRHELTDKKYRLMMSGNYRIYINGNCLPRFYTVENLKFLPEDKIIEYISGKEFSPKEEVVLDEKIKGRINFKPNRKKHNKALCFIEGYKLNEIELIFETTAPSWLVTSEVFYPGWKAALDGKEVEIFKANHAFKSLFLPKGSHRVRFYYFPGTFKAGAGISFLSLILALMLESILGFVMRIKKYGRLF